LKFDSIEKNINNPNMQKFLTMLEGMAPSPKDYKNTARDEQPFVTEIAWAYFSAYPALCHREGSRFARKIEAQNWAQPAGTTKL
jgi:hypothetical protein